MNAAVVPAATIGSNIFSYGLLLAAAHLLSPSSYGELSALLGVLLVATVPLLALQTVTARRTATSSDTTGLGSATAIAGLGTAAVVVVAAPAMAAFLHLDSVLGVLLVAASVPAGTVLGTLLGEAQGRRDFHRLAALTALTTLGRSLGGLIGLILGHSTLSTLFGVSAGLTVIAASAIRLRLASIGTRSVWKSPASPWPLLREAVHAAHAHIAFLVVTSLDVLLARHLLDANDAGLYAVGSVVTRAALWLPQSVGLMLFASMSVLDRHHSAVRRAVAAVLATGLVTVVGCLVAGRLVVDLVGGANYQALSSTVWIFALLGVCLALVQLGVLAGLARRRPQRVVLLWITGALDVGLVLALGTDATPFRIVFVLTGIAALAAISVIALSMRSTLAGRRAADQLGSSAAGHA